LAEFVLALPGDPETKTGGYGYDRSLVAALRERGHAASILQLPDDFPAPSPASIETGLALLAQVSRAATLIVDGLAFGALPADGLGALGRPLVALVHHPLALETGLSEDEALRLATFERSALATAARILVTSEPTRALLERDYDVSPARIAVARPGVDPAPRATRAGAPPIILTVAAVSPRKDHATLARTLAKLTDLDWRWRIVGPLDRDHSCAAELAALIVDLGLSERTELAGPLDSGGVEAAYASADIFVLPSRFEGYGMVFAEALACGLPVVAGACEAAEALVPAEAGALVKPGDVEGFAAALRNLLEDPAARDAASEAAWEAGCMLPRWSDAAAIVERIAQRLKQAPRDHGFDPAWLDLREAADHAAIAEAPLAELVRVFGDRETVAVVDLGAGSGSTLRFLAPRLGPHQRWLLIDDDDRVLAHARRRLRGWAEQVDEQDDALILLKAGRQIEIRFARRDLASDPLPPDAEACDLITASAFFDLVSRDWQHRFAARLAATGAAFYARLTYDGAATFQSPHPLDSAVLAAFNRHQRGDKGFGWALGPVAGPALTEVMDLGGFSCREGQSPWTLHAADAALVEKLVEGMAAAAEETPDRPDGVSDWLAFRRGAAARPEALATIGHTDQLFLPPVR
jgi:glycosyltransferase involved in cell wall biosynthesis/SAM-dependent methyltransferase